MVKKITFLCFGILMMLQSMGQSRFKATITPSRINKDEYVILRLEVKNSNDVQKISAPSLKNFNIVSGPNQESGMSYVNGQQSQYIALSFVLQPRTPGKIYIEPATAIIGGQVFKSNPVKLLVNNALSGQSSPKSNAYSNPFSGIDPFEEEKTPGDFNDYLLRPGESVAEKVSRNMQMCLETDKTSCYVGEPIIATYKLYTRLKSESKLTKNPSFNGFSVIDLQQPDVTGYAVGKLNGKEYNVYTIRKAQLYPLQKGAVELESATLENSVRFIKDDGNRRRGTDIFNEFTISPDDMVSQTISLSSKPVIINVKPLPEAGRPPTFTGAVGDFNLDAVVEKNNFSTDETGNLIITITGSGNLQLVTAPEISWPQGMEAFEPSLIDDLNTTTVPVTGKRTFTFSFSIQNPGDYVLGPVLFSYFDPKASSYRTISTNAINLHVAKGINKPKSPFLIVNKDQTTGINSIFKHRGWMAIILGGLIIISLMVWLIRDKRKVNAIKPLPLTKIPDETMHFLAAAAISQQNPLSESEACLNREECIEFYEILNREMKAFLIHKFSLNPPDIAYKKIMSAMDAAGVENTITLQVDQLLHDIEWQLYTPFERDEKMSSTYSRAQELIQLINTYHPVTP